ncbi:restriction endonuclease [Streptomyces cinnamoneus]|uniref:restriction endonuclease n=1 Tax=Streptomyces cinnamoneus TaxID=53446 RepID=UPI003449C1E8
MAAAIVLGVLGLALRRLARFLQELGPYLWPVIFVTSGCAAAVYCSRLARRRAARRERARRLERLRMPLYEVDALSPGQFELAIRDLMARDGISARHVGRRGDQAADVIGRDTDGRVIVAQCKHTMFGGRVGSHVMYEVNGTATPVHGADVAVVVTNGGFTRDARSWGDRNGVHWIDRERLRAWAEEGRSLHQVLGLATPASGRTGA